MKLYFGKVVEYFDRGYGFIHPLDFDKIDREISVFFHISKLKNLNIENELIFLNRNNQEEVFLWFTTEKTKKGIALDQCWCDSKEIPSDYLSSYVNEICGSLIKKSQDSNSKKTRTKFESKEENFLRSIKSFRRAGKSEILIESNKTDPEIETEEKVSEELDIDKKFNLSSSETDEVKSYIKIFQEQKCEQHFQVNHFITRNRLWDKFPTMRSLNDHGKNKGIPGILPKYYSIVCDVLNIDGCGGEKLDKSTHY